mmetsp:Transcript_5735/g.9565  ORF Transcript_5735/g.9565 Transcript_5735/m.9565 type:complete len:143 (+) Transcript_5735:478-906(+)
MLGSKRVAPPSHPWQLKVAESYVFPLDASKFDRARVDLHLTSDADQKDFLYSGFGAVMLVRYSDFPVGPYDELLLIPGAFEPKGTARKPFLADRLVTRIYVSSIASVKQGRKNWGIRAGQIYLERGELLPSSSHGVSQRLCR